jgi:hypothetical protein
MVKYMRDLIKAPLARQIVSSDKCMHNRVHLGLGPNGQVVPAEA